MSVQSDVKDLLRLHADQHHREKTRRRLMHAIHAIGSVEGQSNLLEEIAVRCERAYWAEANPTRQQELKRVVEQFFHELSEACLAQGSIALFLENVRALRRFGLDPMRMLVARGRYSDSECRYAARMWFMLAWHRYIGASEVQSARFALLLLERVGRLTQQAHDAGELSDVRATFRRLTALGIDAERLRTVVAALERGASMSEASALLGDVSTSAQLRLRNEVLARTPSMQILELLEMLLEDAVSPTHHDTPAKWWIERLIEASSHDDAVSEVLSSMFRVLTIFRPDFRTDVLEQLDTSTATAAEFVAERMIAGASIPPTATPRLVLSRRHARLLREWNARELQADAGRRSRGDEVIARFAACRDRVRDETRRRWEDVCTCPRYGLLPDGRDHIEILVEPLWNAGVRGFAFHPEGHDFPDVDIDLLVRKETPHLVAFRVPVGATLAVAEDVVRNLAHPDLDILREMLHTVVIDAMHRIVVGGRPVRRRTAAHPSRVEQHIVDRTMLDLEPESSERRAHFRRLPEGQHVSEVARTRALEQRGWIPAGCTFVRAHYQERRLVYALPARQSIVYTADDLFDFGGGA